AVQWRLVDEVARPTEFEAAVRRIAEAAVGRSARPTGASDLEGIELTPLHAFSDGAGLRYEHVRVEFDRALGVATITVTGPVRAVADAGELHEAGAAAWPLAAGRELDDAISRLRFSEPELG